MVITSRTVTPAEFDQFLAAHADTNRIFQLIDGEIVELPSNSTSSSYVMLPGFTLPVSDIFTPEVPDQLEQKDETPE